jgi:hypothetical protein
MLPVFFNIPQASCCLPVWSDSVGIKTLQFYCILGGKALLVKA